MKVPVPLHTGQAGAGMCRAGPGSAGPEQCFSPRPGPLQPPGEEGHGHGWESVRSVIKQAAGLYLCKG